MLSLSSVSSDSIKVRMPLHALGIEVPAHIKQSSTSAGNFCAFVARRASKTPCRASKTPDMASKNHWQCLHNPCQASKNPWQGLQNPW